MNFNDGKVLFDAALDFATKAHANQTRKYTGEPYITHPQEVVQILLGHGIRDFKTLSAAYLHDVVEDCGVKFDEIEAIFGRDVMLMVWELTDVEPISMATRKTRKALTRYRLRKASLGAIQIKLADQLSNAKSIFQHDPDGFGGVYHGEAMLLFKEVFAERRWTDHTLPNLVRELEIELEQFRIKQNQKYMGKILSDANS